MRKFNAASVVLLSLCTIMLCDSMANCSAATVKADSDSGSDKSPSDTAKDDDNDNKKSDSSSSKSNDDGDKTPERPKRTFSGNASWYGIPFHGRKTASGEIFNMYKPSAAHLTLPLPSKALVEDPRTGNAVIVKVNDRGPYVKTRVMDLSREAARTLGILSRGVAFIEVTDLGRIAKSSTKKQ